MNTIDKVKELREAVMKVATANKQGHIAPSLSCLDILTVLYYEVMGPNDVFVLSKGHGCYGLYAIWADQNGLDHDWVKRGYDGCLEGCGSLGHGFPVAVGMAWAKQLGKMPGHVWVVTGDGEWQEGSMWEALDFAGFHGLTNLTVIVDDNGLQAMDATREISGCNLFEKFKAFGMMPFVCHDGHNHDQLIRWLEARPEVLICHTIKGKGYKFMEGKAEFHYRCPSVGDLEVN